jgi:hypothetical protein
MLSRGAEWRDLNTSPNLLVAGLVLAAGLPCIALFDVTAPAAVLEEHLSIVGFVPELSPSSTPRTRRRRRIWRSYWSR